MKRWVYLLFAAAAASGALSSPAFADRYDEHWYHGPIHEFHEHDLHAWRGGRWYHGYYGGRSGWYWIVGGVYYWYPQPVYPYPNPYVPPEALAGGVAVPPAPAVAAAIPAIPQAAPIYPPAVPASPQEAPAIPQAAPIAPQSGP